MGESADATIAAFEFQKSESTDRRRSHREQSPKMLTGAGIAFASKNNGAHLIVEDRWDFWPGTGLYIDRATNFRGRGVRNLIKHTKRLLGGEMCPYK